MAPKCSFSSNLGDGGESCCELVGCDDALSLSWNDDGSNASRKGWEPDLVEVRFGASAPVILVDVVVVMGFGIMGVDPVFLSS